jgi:hypothetical protein
MTFALEQFTIECGRRCAAPGCGIEAAEARRIKKIWQTRLTKMPLPAASVCGYTQS